MKQVIIHTVIAGLEAALNALVDRREAAWLPGRVESCRDNVALVLSEDVGRSPLASGAIIGYKVLHGTSEDCQRELEALKAANPYHEAVSVAIVDNGEVSELSTEKSAVPAGEPVAKKAAKKAAKKSAKKASVVGPAFEVLVLVALRQP